MMKIQDRCLDFEIEIAEGATPGAYLVSFYSESQRVAQTQGKRLRIMVDTQVPAIALLLRHFSVEEAGSNPPGALGRFGEAERWATPALYTHATGGKPWALQEHETFKAHTDVTRLIDAIHQQQNRIAAIFREEEHGCPLTQREMNPQSMSRGGNDQKAAVKILFLTASPSDTARLRLEQESRAIDQALRQTAYRDQFNVIQHWAVRVSDIQGFLLRYQPDIVHFSGHGSESGEIILEDGAGKSHPVSMRALSTLFSTLKGNIRCVVLSACYSDQQAQAIAESIDCVIGMSNTIEDTSAINFSTAFYQALGYGKDVQTAFDLGCLEIDLQNLRQQDVPKLIARKCKANNLIFAHNVHSAGNWPGETMQ